MAKPIAENATRATGVAISSRSPSWMIARPLPRRVAARITPDALQIVGLAVKGSVIDDLVSVTSEVNDGADRHHRGGEKDTGTRAESR